MIPRRKFIQIAAGSALGPLPGRGAGSRSQDWKHYGADPESSRYSPLSQITPANVASLKVAWVHHSAAENSRYRGSPVLT